MGVCVSVGRIGQGDAGCSRICWKLKKSLGKRAFILSRNWIENTAALIIIWSQRIIQSNDLSGASDHRIWWGDLWLAKGARWWRFARTTSRIRTAIRFCALLDVRHRKLSTYYCKICTRRWGSLAREREVNSLKNGCFLNVRKKMNLKTFQRLMI